MPEALPPAPPISWRRPLRKILDNWGQRHRHPFNFWIHLIGIPLAVAGVVLFFFLPWYWALMVLISGYFLQYLGHRVEGNDVGEWAAIKRLLGLPYVSVAPGRQESRSVDSSKPVTHSMPR